MITSRAEYRRYLEADRIALHRRPSAAAWLSDEVWRYQRRLRRAEYYTNSGRRWRALWAEFVLIRSGNRLGFTVPRNVFGPGLSMAHPGTVAVNQHARVGSRCRVSVNVVIGADLRVSDAAPLIGDDCFLGPGAVLLGKIVLGDHVIVGANAVVTRSFPEGHLTLIGAPARPMPTPSESKVTAV